MAKTKEKNDANSDRIKAWVHQANKWMQRAGSEYQHTIMRMDIHPSHRDAFSYALEELAALDRERNELGL